MSARFLHAIAASSAPTPEATDLVADVVFIDDSGKPTDLGGSGGSYTLPAASASALGGVKLATAVADVAATDATNATGETPTAAEFQAVVTELNETKQKLNALLAALRASGALASA